MPKNETELATQVLKDLGVIGAGQSPEAADVADVVSAYRIKYAELGGSGLEYTFWSMEAIPETIFFILRDLVTLEVRGSFGQPISASEKEIEDAKIMKRLRRHVGLPATGVPTESVYF
jgi:hypothetical protein